MIINEEEGEKKRIQTEIITIFNESWPKFRFFNSKGTFVSIYGVPRIVAEVDGKCSAAFAENLTYSLTSAVIARKCFALNTGYPKIMNARQSAPEREL